MALLLLLLRYSRTRSWNAVSTTSREGFEKLLRSSADLDHALLEIARRSPRPPLVLGRFERDGEEGTWRTSSDCFGCKVRSATDLLASSACGSAWKWANIGLGSVGLEILGFLTELMLERGSLAADTARVSRGFLPNHLEGLDKNWVSPEGELERNGGKCGFAGEAGVEDGGASCGLSELAPRRGGIGRVEGG